MEQHIVTPVWCLTEQGILEAEVPTNWLEEMINTETPVTEVGCKFFIERSEGGQERAKRIRESKMTDVLVAIEPQMDIYVN